MPHPSRPPPSAGSPPPYGTSRSDRAHSSRTADARAMLAAGSPAPAFSLRCGPYRETTLDDYRGKRLVVVFYVADWHPVCTGQLLRYRKLLPELQRLGAELAAVSADTVWSHAAFAHAYRLPFPLLSDEQPRSKTAQTCGVMGAQRGLLVIDTD